MMKKIRLAMAVVLALMALSLSAVMAAKEDGKVLLTVTSSKEKVDVGDIIEVGVSISENSDITALQFILSYDSAAVELLDEPILKHSQLTLMLNTDTPGKIGVYSYSNDVSKGVSAGGVLLTATFKVLKPNATFNISDLQEAYDSNDDDISANVEMTEAVISCAHSHTETMVTKEAACTESGLKEAYCTVCGEKVAEEEIPATGHTQGEWEVVTEADCTNKGLKRKSCMVCGEVLEEEEIPAKGHSFGEWVVVEEATVEKNGKEERICTVCGFKETRETEKLTPEPTETPDVTPSPEPTETPEVTPSAAPTEEPGTTPSATPTDAPNVTPSTGEDDAPVTGDSVHTGIFLAVMLITAAVFSVVIWKKKEA